MGTVDRRHVLQPSRRTTRAFLRFLSDRRSVAQPKRGMWTVLVGYISRVETLRMLPLGSPNQTAFCELPIEATPSFHSTRSTSNV